MRELWKTMREDIHHGYEYLEYNLDHEWLDVWNVKFILETRNNTLLMYFTTYEIHEGKPGDWFECTYPIDIKEFMKMRFEEFESFLGEVLYYNTVPMEMDDNE